MSSAFLTLQVSCGVIFEMKSRNILIIMTIKSLFYFSTLLILTGITSIQCRSSDDSNDPANSAEPTVYAAGREGYKAKYWKNGTTVLLGQGSGSSDVRGDNISID